MLIYERDFPCPSIWKNLSLSKGHIHNKYGQQNLKTPSAFKRNLCSPELMCMYGDVVSFSIFFGKLHEQELFV